MNNKHVMIDIETMSTLPSASIISIAAVMFDPYGDQNADELAKNPTYNTHISLADNQKRGRHIDGDTVMWWLTQSQDAQRALCEAPKTNLANGLGGLLTFLANNQPTHVWANDPDFDVVILNSALRDCNLRWPFGFWMNRSVRTVKDLAYPDGDCPHFEVGTAHDALDDCFKQALLVQHCVWKINS